MGHVGDSILAPTSPCLCMAHAHLSLGLCPHHAGQKLFCRVCLHRVRGCKQHGESSEVWRRWAGDHRLLMKVGRNKGISHCLWAR